MQNTRKQNKEDEDLNQTQVPSKREGLKEVAGQIRNLNMSELPERTFQLNREKGFWKERLELPEKMESKGFSREEIDFVKNAISSQQNMLIVTEVAEAEEVKRKKGQSADVISHVHRTENLFDREDISEEEKAKIFKQSFETYIKDSEEDEMADQVIRINDKAGGNGVDLAFHIREKMIYNYLRGFKHGKSY